MASGLIRAVLGAMLVIVFPLVLAACGHSSSSEDEHSTPRPSTTQAQQISGNQPLKERVFAGQLPCNEPQCSGITTRITLRSTMDNQPGGFSISETYKDGDSTKRVVTVLGQWSLVTGTAGNQHAVVYQIGTMNNRPLLFELINAKTLRLLKNNLSAHGSDGQSDAAHYDLTLQPSAH